MLIETLMRKILLLIIALAILHCNRNPEKHASEIVSKILENKSLIEKSSQCEGGCIFLTAWDFDGTILKGDATEGLVENDRDIYPGLEQVCIEAGHSALYSKTEFKKFWKDYEEMDKKKGHTAAYTFLPKAFKGAMESDLRAIAAKHYAKILSPYYFKSSVQIFRDLKKAGVTPYVISAAPHIFVRTSGPTLDIEESHIFGIEVAISDDGKVTDRVVEPVPYADGKAKRLSMIVAGEKARSKKPVFVLASFGNSYHTDSNFLMWTLDKQAFPAGRPLAVMINGGQAPEKYAGKFTEITQEVVAGK